MSVKEGEEVLEGYVMDAYLTNSFTDPIIISVTAVVMVTYLMTYLFVAIREKTKLPKPNLHMPVGDALETSNSYYVVTIATGLRKGAGLKSDGVVRVSLTGSLSDPDPLVISNVKTPGASPPLRRGGVDQFLLPAKGDLGEILSVDIDLQSVNSETVSWYVKYIRVSDVWFGVHSYFVFDRWLTTCDYMRTGVHQSGISQSRAFVEKFMELFVDLNVWTAAWSRSCEIGAFSRSIRLTFSAFILSFVMFVNVLVCLVPAMYKQSHKEPLPALATLIPTTMARGFGVSMVVFLLQYTVEIILRRIRIKSGSQDLMVRRRNMWKRKPLPQSLYPMYVNRLQQNLGQNPSQQPEEYKYVWEKSDGNGFLTAGLQYEGEVSSAFKKDVMHAWDKISSKQPYRQGYRPLVSVEDVDTAADEDAGDTTLVPGEESFIGDNTQSPALLSPGFVDGFGYPIKDGSKGYMNNSNSNDEVKGSSFDVESAIWNELSGIINSSKEESKQEKSSGRKLAQRSSYQEHLLEGVAKNLVSLILQEVKGSLKEYYKTISTSTPNMERIQGQVIKCLLQLSEDWTNNILGSLKSGQEPQKVLREGSSDAQISAASKSSKSPKSQSPSVTTSCPEMNPSSGDILEKMGPVAKRLAESVSSTASKNSLSRLQNKSSTTLAKDSVERMNSLSSFAESVKVSSKVLIHTSSCTPETEDTGKQDKASLANLVDYITPERVNRLTEANMSHVARASLKTLTSEETLKKFKEAAAEYNEKATQSFTFEVVNNLYQIVRAKMECLLENERGISKEKDSQISDLINAANAEAEENVVPQLVKYVESLLVEQAKSLQDIDVDLVMMAFSGQYVDTIVTNAVLQTHVGLLKAKESLQDMKGEFLSKQDVNANNNKTNAIDHALMMLESTSELEDVIEKLCKCMLATYKQKHGFTMDLAKTTEEALLAAFRNKVANYESFERILTESAQYLRHMSENVNLSEVYGDGKMMSELSEKFLCDGFEVEEHVSVSERLSEHFLAVSLDHACCVVGAELVEPFLSCDVDMLVEEETKTGSTKHEEGVKTKKLPASKVSYRKTEHKSSSVPFPSQTKAPKIHITKVEMQSANGQSPKSIIKHDQPKKSGASRKSGHISAAIHYPKTNIEITIDGKSSKSSQLPGSKTPESPLGASTPNAGLTPSSAQKPPSWETSNYTGTPERTRPQNKVKVSSRGPVARIMYEESEVDSLASAPINPASTQESYGDWTQPNIAGTTWSLGLPYIPPDTEPFPAASRSEEHLERMWRLDLARDVMGETSKCLPSFMMLILHALLSIFTVAFLSACIMFGMRLPINIAIAWSVALVFILFLHAFIFEPLKVMVVSLYYVSCYDESM